MKRKDYQDKYGDFSSVYLSSSFAKSRRLDPDLLPFTSEDPIGGGVGSEVVGPFTSSTPETDSLGFGTANAPSSGGDCGNEKALVLYNPTNTPLFKSPTSPDFSVIVNSDLIPGLKDQLFLVGNSKIGKPLQVAMAKDNIIDISDDHRLAIVPWVAQRAEPQAVHMSAATEAEEIELMDTDDNSGGPEGAMEGAGGLQQWQQQQQHCLRPELFQNSYTPVTW